MRKLYTHTMGRGKLLFPIASPYGTSPFTMGMPSNTTAALDASESGTIRIELFGPRGVGKSLIANIIRKALLDAGAPSVTFSAYRLADADAGYAAPSEYYESTVVEAVTLTPLKDRPNRKIEITEKIEEAEQKPVASTNA